MFDKKNFPTVEQITGKLPTDSRINLYSGWQVIAYTIGNTFDESMYGRKPVTAVTQDRAGGYSLDVMLA